MKQAMSFLLMAMVMSNLAFAANTPCSGKKGGVSHCQGSKFICNDGSISGSKRVCPVEAYGKKAK